MSVDKIPAALTAPIYAKIYTAVRGGSVSYKCHDAVTAWSFSTPTLSKLLFFIREESIL
jgi:hypothetical protein